MGDGKAAYLLVRKVMELLGLSIKSGDLADTHRLADLCYSLYRGIDYALINNEVPMRGRELPLLLKQICCDFISDVVVRTAVMVLMISVKNACRSGWFPDKDMADLLELAKEVSMPFGDEDIYIEPSNAQPYVSKIMSRFYPQIKMGNILVSLKVKPGYSAFWVDFQISKSMLATGQTKIGLFVAQTENMDTSSCLVTPSEANFLLNGYGMLGRTVGPLMIKGPQLPTDITPMLKYGINLFQVLGQLDGDYLIIIASASLTSTSDTSWLQDYVQPALASAVSDLEIIEGPSRVSLSCPISHKRIKTPVKGHLCKHYQCFEYENFMKIHLKKPAWRCPQCSQPVCFPDLRIDRSMAKILAAVGESVDHVMIFADGSWKAVMENEQPSDKKECRSRSCDHETPEQTDVIDITKEVANESDSPSISYNNHPGGTVVRNSGAQREDDIMSRISIPVSTFQTASSTSASPGGHRTEFLSIDPPIFNDNVSPVSDQQYRDAFGRTQLPIPSWQTPVFNSNLLQLRVGSKEYSPVSRFASRTPFAALSPQAQDIRSLEQRFSSNSFIPPGTTFQSTSFPQIRGSFLSSPVSSMDSSSMKHQLLAQSSAAQEYWNMIGRSVDRCSSQSPPGYAYTQPAMRSPSLAYPHTPYTQTQSVQIPQGYGGSSSSQPQPDVVAPSIPISLQSSRTTPPLMAGTSGGLRKQKRAASEEYWQPTKRMRGGLMGDAYIDALNKFVLQPSTAVTRMDPRIDQTMPSERVSEASGMSQTLPSMNQMHGQVSIDQSIAQTNEKHGIDSSNTGCDQTCQRSGNVAVNWSSLAEQHAGLQ